MPRRNEIRIAIKQKSTKGSRVLKKYFYKYVIVAARQVFYLGTMQKM